MDLAEQSERMQAFYNLKYDPFGALVDAMVFSAAGNRYDIAETIRHLLNYSEQDGLVIGSPGSGKRMLVQHVLKMLEEHWRIAWLDANDLSSQEDVLKELSGQLGLGLKISSDVDALLITAQEHIQQRIEDGEMFLIVVQFADRLPIELQSFIQSIRYVAVNLDSRVRQLWLLDEQHYDERSFVTDDWYSYLLEPFSEHDTQQYLRDRLVAAGSVGELPFTDKDIARLTQLAEGSITALNELSRDFLIGSTFRTVERKINFPITHVVAGIAAACLVVIAILYSVSDSADKAIEVDSAALPMSDVERRLAEATARIEANRSDQQSSSTAVDDPVEQAASVEIVSDVVPEVQQTLPLPSTEEPADIPVVQAPESDIGTASEASSPTQTSLLYSAPNQAFTLQLIGVRDRSALVPLIAAFPDPSLADVVETQFESRPWYVLIYGQFETRSAANAYISQLPKEFSGQTPWIRTFEAVRQGISR